MATSQTFLGEDNDTIRESIKMSNEQQNRDRLIDYALGEHDFCLGYKPLDNQSEHYYDGYIDAKRREKCSVAEYYMEN